MSIESPEESTPVEPGIENEGFAQNEDDASKEMEKVIPVVNVEVHEPPSKMSNSRTCYKLDPLNYVYYI